jgi:proline dehydrogenase
MNERELLILGSEVLKKMASNDEAKEYVLKNEALYELLKKAANRYIGGRSLSETIDKVRNENGKGLKCSIEFMGENTRNEKEAIEATSEFLRISKNIKDNLLNSTISLDLSHIGLAISRDLCWRNLSAICTSAEKSGIEVIISAEAIERTDEVIETYKWAVKKHNNLSITLQAYLHRTQDDFKDLIKEQGRIRMVKGAFDVPSEAALSRGKELDKRYLDYVEQLLSSNHKCSIATHHEIIQHESKKMIELHKPDRETFEFESLYGIQTEQLMALKNEGYPTKLYFVYGKEWYLYLCNRIAEYPLNIFRALNDCVS